MCDTAVLVAPGRVLFAKNSDRDPNEAQLLEWQARGRFAAGEMLQCTWALIPQVRETHAVLLSRPYWMWGAEMGANEHGVVIGNEAVFTREPLAKDGLTGMDLVRLGLERAANALGAVGVIIELLESVGQGGGCGHERRDFSYHNSFLLADGSDAFVLETAGRKWTTERVESGARSISNGLTIEPFASRHGDRLRTRVADAESRRTCTTRSAGAARGLHDMMRLLRDHGEGRGAPAYSRLNGAMAAPCMHAGGLAAASQTTASWVSLLTPGGAQHWVTGTGSPCTGLFKPVRVEAPLELGPAPADFDDGASLWWRHERLARLVMREPERLLPLYAAERDALEASWLSAPPEPKEAFALGDRRIDEWTARVRESAGSDLRPRYVRRYWATRDARARLGAES